MRPALGEPRHGGDADPLGQMFGQEPQTLWSLHEIIALWGAVWRKGWDSNPRMLAHRRFSRPVQSTTLPPFRVRSGQDTAATNAHASDCPKRSEDGRACERPPRVAAGSPLRSSGACRPPLAMLRREQEATRWPDLPQSFAKTQTQCILRLTGARKNGPSSSLTGLRSERCGADRTQRRWGEYGQDLFCRGWWLVLPLCGVWLC